MFASQTPHCVHSWWAITIHYRHRACTLRACIMHAHRTHKHTAAHEMPSPAQSPSLISLNVSVAEPKVLNEFRLRCLRAKIQSNDFDWPPFVVLPIAACTYRYSNRCTPISVINLGKYFDILRQHICSHSFGSPAKLRSPFQLKTNPIR